MKRVSTFATLDAMAVPLSGINLVEANAGTGKTYNIVSLYLRLILEATMTVDQILVVSFTEAATAELRQRLRTRLAELQRVFETGVGKPDELRFVEACDDRETGLRRIVRALQSFDQAAVYTIHGFCQRVLSDAAFEAGLSQNTELITDDNALRKQLIDDFWHTETATGSTLWVSYLLEKSKPDTLYKQLARYFARPLIRRIASVDPASSDELEANFSKLYRQAQKDWSLYREEISELLYSSPGLNRNVYRTTSVDKLLANADQSFAGGGASIDALLELEKLGFAKIQKSTKKKFEPPHHVFFDLFQQLWDMQLQLQPIFSQRLAAMRMRLLEFADQELRHRKQERRLRHFDDLLIDVYSVLQSAQAASLRQAVTQQYRAALIDEFQDTDPLQFSIFDSLFCRSETPVFFVGDPKQAIYGFRGADVYAYLDARERATGRYRLDLNYRSTPQLVESVNAVFQRSTNPFVIEQIGFNASAAAKDKPGLIIDGKEQPAMHWWQVAPKDGQDLNSAELNRQIAESVATEIARLLDLIAEKRVTKPGDTENVPLEAKDIAVLVNFHEHGRLVRDALAHRGVACMQRTEDNVFRTAEADELWCLLRAVVEPSRHPLVRAALATELLGFDAKKIDALEQDDQQWQDLLDRFASYPQLWRQHGFSRMYRRVLLDFDVERRLLRLVHGQRRVTNLVHLADLLQRESSRRHGRLDEVLVWMREQQLAQQTTDQSMLLRLDSDEDLVSIMTVHFSKGLQFPVVFCPYLWTVISEKKWELVEFHDEQNRASLDLGEESVHKDQAKAEHLAERVRLAYVAMTRAELACYSVWGSIPNTKQSSLNWLLHPAAATGMDVQKMKLATDNEVASSLASLAADAIISGPMPAASPQRVRARKTAVTELKPRVLGHEVPGGWRVSSFSAMTRHVVEEPRDYDAGKSADKPVLLEPQGIFAFPRGARAGRCMHALLENISFDAGLAEIRTVAGQVLVDHGYDKDQDAVLAEMAVNVLATNLSRTADIRLRNVADTRRVVEMEFYFSITGLDARALRHTLGAFGSGTAIEHRLAQLEFRVSGGFMHGFIDLIFEADGRYYLVDYKSNWLGNEAKDYRVDRLQQEISKHDYYLQYLIYSVALHRHLALRLPDYDYDGHFGGAYYLFLRGMHPDNGPDYGVFHDRPGRTTMERLEELFGNTVGIDH